MFLLVSLLMLDMVVVNTGIGAKRENGGGAASDEFNFNVTHYKHLSS